MKCSFFSDKTAFVLKRFLVRERIFILLFCFGCFYYLYCNFQEDGTGNGSFLLKLPVVKRLIVLTAATRFAAILGILLRAGIPLMSSFDIVNMVVGNEVFRKGRQVKEMARMGSGISAPWSNWTYFRLC